MRRLEENVSILHLPLVGGWVGCPDTWLLSFHTIAHRPPPYSLQDIVTFRHLYDAFYGHVSKTDTNLDKLDSDHAKISWWIWYFVWEANLRRRWTLKRDHFSPNQSWQYQDFERSGHNQGWQNVRDNATSVSGAPVAKSKCELVTEINLQVFCKILRLH